jgi:hypothetical protein
MVEGAEIKDSHPLEHGMLQVVRCGSIRVVVVVKRHELERSIPSLLIMALFCTVRLSIGSLQ